MTVYKQFDAYITWLVIVKNLIIVATINRNEHLYIGLRIFSI